MTSTTKPSYHPGKSWLGEILMKIRSQLISKDVAKTKCSDVVMPADALVHCLESPHTLDVEGQPIRIMAKKKISRSVENKIHSTSISPSRSQPL